MTNATERKQNTVDVTADTLRATIGSGIVLIDFWAPWCGPCRAFAPVYEAASREHDDVVFAKVDTEAERGLAGAFGIRAIPTLAVFRDGVLLAMQPGALSQRALEQLIDDVRALDMTDIKRQIAEKASAQKESA